MKICLTMILKDEAHIIGRSLADVRDLLDRWVVVDTGSTDGTVDEVQKALDGIPGRIDHHVWDGFGSSRTHAFDIARSMLASEGEDLSEWYGLVLDADEVVTREPDAKKGLAGADVYRVWIQMNNVRFPQFRFFRMDKPWRYVGVLHEFPTFTPGPWKDGTLEGFTLGTRSEGSRSKDPTKYRRDAELLEASLLNEEDALLRTRYVFYLAQSYRDAGMDADAEREYLRRADMGAGLNWEEIYMALLNAGRAQNRQGQGDKALKTFMRAYETWPARIEATRELAAMFAHRVNTSPKDGTLFVEV